MRVSFPQDRMERRWWRDWWSDDYSWLSLKKKLLGQHSAGFIGSLFGSKSLQDYWRADTAGQSRGDAELERQGELVRDPNGRLWHIAHVPLQWRDGSAAKSAWSGAQREHLQKLIVERLQKTERSSFSFGSQPNGKDGRAQLQGAVLLDPPSLQGSATPALRIRCDRGWIPAWEAAGEIFADGASFERALFNGHTRLHRAKFEGGVSFESARFMGDLVCGLVDEHASAGFPGLANFRHAMILGNTHLDRCRFANLRFDYACFAGRVECFAAQVESACFEGVTFHDRVSFLSTQIKGSLELGSVRARGDVELGSTDFSQAMLWFRHSKFDGVFRFSGVKMPRKTSALVGGFDGVRFRGTPTFESNGLQWIAALANATFEQGLMLDKPAPAVAEREFEKSLAAALKVSRGSEMPEKELEMQLAALEGGCRTIHREAAKAGDVGTEALYAKFEIKVLEQRRRLPAAPPSDDDEA